MYVLLELNYRKKATNNNLDATRNLKATLRRVLFLEDTVCCNSLVYIL